MLLTLCKSAPNEWSGSNGSHCTNYLSSFTVYYSFVKHIEPLNYLVRSFVIEESDHMSCVLYSLMLEMQRDNTLNVTVLLVLLFGSNFYMTNLLKLIINSLPYFIMQIDVLRKR